MILPASYSNGFAPRDGMPLYPSLWKSCVGAWAPCLGATGLTLRDWSGRGNHGTLTNMLADSDWALSGGRYSLDFDGVNDTVAIATPQLSVWTIAMWIRNNAWTSNLSGFFQSGPEFGNNDGGGSAAGKLSVGRVGVYNPVGISATTLSNGVWYHIAASMSAGLICKLYVNGRQDSSDLSYVGKNVTLSTTGAISGLSGSRVYSGLIDDVMLYSRDLSAQEIRTLATRRGIAFEMAPRRRSRVSVLASLRYNIFTGNVGSLEVIGAS